MRDKPRNTATKPAPPVTINNAGSRVTIITAVILTVVLPTFSFNSRRRFSRSRSPKRFNGSCTAPPCWSTWAIRRQMADRSSLSNPAASRASDCSRVRPRTYSSDASRSS